MVPEKFVFSNKPFSWKLTKSSVPAIGKYEYLQGKYVVVKTSMQGGGMGHGPNDIYPNGHLVECKRIHQDKVLDDCDISFYQTGCFNNMIRDIEPIGRAKTSYVLESKDV